MSTHRHDHQTPPDCFPLEALEAFQSIENQVLADVNYYLWLHQPEPDAAPQHFLYFLELLFEDHEPLLLTSGEDSTALRISDAETLVNTARQLQALNAGEASVRRVTAGASRLWEPAVGQPLHTVRLSRNEEGLYLNDALVLDFGSQAVLVSLHPRGGMAVSEYA